MKLKAVILMVTLLFALGAPAQASRAASEGQVKSVVDSAIEPLIAKHHVPGMAVGIVANGKTYVFDYGMASAETGKPVTQRTLFEIGSVSKTFTATLAEYAQLNGHLRLSDPTQT